ncbi:hypothetical protein DFQ04_1367 [Algoriphagus boseongensis]|uniref:Uncharacterized protein n=1 Tax=Algoriphagus boseongensis TaxID=1442587 RepID=A0A4R6TDN3_9BACT|nr:hypothetical protein [Algoriphagus boseongensis]TDQ19544.1 hypothetical protein DFQ04_1367 [Algoriphagus boseongensis]
MKNLPKNWITEGLIDFEYKKYQLLAYLQNAEKEFQAVKLYPVLGDLIEHHRTLKELESGKTELRNLFPKALNGIDLQNAQLKYESQVQDGRVMEEIAQITSFALPKLKHQIEEGKSIYDFVEEQIEFEPVGILPIYNREGYILLTQENRKEIHAFRYKSNFLQLAGERFRSITLWLVGIFQKTLVNTLEKLKMELVKEIKELPNPATWRMHSQGAFPIEETLVPVGKRLLLRSVTE